MGIPLVRISNDLMKKTGNIRSCVMYTKKAIKYGELAGFNEVSIDKIPTKHNNIQILHKISLGATRMDEKRVVEINRETWPNLLFAILLGLDGLTEKKSNCSAINLMILCHFFMVKK